jgi:hypothetical protein
MKFAWIGPLLAVPLGLACAMSAAAQDTVTVGNETKRAFGTVTSLNAGDTACHVKLRDDRGATFEEMAQFEICEQRALIGKRVALTYVQQSVMSPACQGDPACRKTIRVVLVGSAKPAPAVKPTAPPSPSGTSAAQTSFCTSQETVVFSCRTGAKMVSVCASRPAGPTRGYLQYRFGKPDSSEPLEMILPESQLPPPRVAAGENVPFSGGGGSWLRFPRAPLAYTVYSGIGKWGPKGEVREKAGVVVERQGKQIANLKCTGKAIGELGPEWFERSGISAGGQDFAFPD